MAIEEPHHFLRRSSILEIGRAIREAMPGITNRQILCCIESFYVKDMQACADDWNSSEQTRSVLMRLISIFFEGLAAELHTDPPKLTFNEILEADRDSATPVDYTEEALQIKKYACSTIVTKSLGRYPWVSYLKDFPASSSPQLPEKTEEHHILDPKTKDNEKSSESITGHSRFPVDMAENKPFAGSTAKIEDDGVAPSTSATKLGLKWGEDRVGDPFGGRVSTEEEGSMEPPFEVLNVGDFDTVRDKMRDLAGDRPATANFDLSSEPDQQLQPDIDLTPKAVRAHIATNMARSEVDQAKVDAVKANEVENLAALVVTTASGLREDEANFNPGFFDTVILALQAARLDSTAEEAYQKLTPEAVRAMRAQIKKEFKDRLSSSVGAEEAPVENCLSRSADAPTVEDEAPARSYLTPVICRVVDKAEMQYSMLYEIVTQMQRERLELGPEVSDYEVIVEAHAGYNAVNEVEAADLTRSADIQTATALAVSISELLRAAQRQGLPVTTVGGISLTQEEITSLLSRCEDLSSSATAVNDYIDSSSANFKKLHTDPFSIPEDTIPSVNASNPDTVKDHESVADTSIVKNRKKQKRKGKGKEMAVEDTQPDTFNNSVEQVEQQIQDMRAFHSRIGTTPRDFSKEIEEIEKELAQLKAHRAKAPGDLVPDSVDGDQGGIRVCAYDYGDGNEPIAEDIQEEMSSYDGKRKPTSRAEQRRLARQRAKDVAKGNE